MGKALLRGLLLTLRHFFRKAETIPYPERYAPSFRSSLTLKKRVREGH